MSSYVPSEKTKDSLAENAPIPLTSMNPKYTGIPLDVAGEKAVQEPWAKKNQLLESKSVGKPLNQVKEPKMPETKPIEPARPGTESIQAVSATKFPTRISEIEDKKESTEPSY